ncbi:MAG: hypothetical protein ACYTX0_44695 [Nostoc sp.]
MGRNSDAQLLETLRVACFHEVVRRRCYPELVEGLRVKPTAVNYAAKQAARWQCQHCGQKCLRQEREAKGTVPL